MAGFGRLCHPPPKICIDNPVVMCDGSLLITVGGEYYFLASLKSDLQNYKGVHHAGSGSQKTHAQGSTQVGSVCQKG